MPSAVRAEILAAYEQRLLATDNPISADPRALRQALRQADAVIDDVTRYRHSGTAEVESRSVSFSLDLGTDRAKQGIHPLHSLRAATALFEVALPPLLRLYTDPEMTPSSSADNVAIALHRSIMVRVTTGSLSYVGFLLDQVYTSHLEERRRIARELHDRVAHAIGVGLQHLDVHRIYRERDADGDAERAARKLHQAGESMRDAITITRELSDELRQSVGPQGLTNALRGYLDTTVPPDVAVEFTVHGDGGAVPVAVAEEIYVVLREAVRNALLHSGTDRLIVTLELSETAVAATVTDFGKGFDGSPEDFRTGGMLSMRERVDLIGGAVSVSVNPAGGTAIRVHVPLPGDGW